MSSKRGKASVTNKKAQSEVMQSQVSNIYDLLKTVDKPKNNNNNNSSNANDNDSDDGYKVVTNKKNVKKQPVKEVDSDGFHSVTYAKGNGKKLQESKSVSANSLVNAVPKSTKNIKTDMEFPRKMTNNSTRNISQSKQSSREKITHNTIDTIEEDSTQSSNVKHEEIENDLPPHMTYEQEQIDNKNSGKSVYVPPVVSEGGWSLANNSKRRYDRSDRTERSDRSEKNDDDEPIDQRNLIVPYDNLVKLPGDDMKLNTPWCVWIHSNDNPNWNLESYKSIYEIDSVGSMWRFLHLLENLDKNVRQYYIMRSGITPIWEDNNNKQGGICSIMIDNMSRSRSGGDLGVDAFTAICVLVLNESFVRNNQIINGLCYSIKSKSVLIKLWIKDFENNKNFRDVLPITILKHIDTVLSSMDVRGGFSGRSNGKSKISVQLKQIKPNN